MSHKIPQIVVKQHCKNFDFTQKKEIFFKSALSGKEKNYTK